MTTAGEIHAVQAAVSRRESTSPTTNSVANMAATTPSMIGMPVRGDVVRRQSVSAPALGSGACAAAASRRASA